MPRLQPTLPPKQPPEAPGSTVISPEATTASDAPTSEPSDGRQGLPEEDLFDFSYKHAPEETEWTSLM